MLAWLAENLATVIICEVLIAVVTGILTYLIRNKKKGKSSCGCACQGCPMRSACHQKK